MENNIYKVENPVYLKTEQIEKNYWDKQVLLTNVEMTSDFSRMDGAIVRYYAIDARAELYQKLAELRRTEGDDIIECCGVEYIGPINLNLYISGRNED